MIAAVGVACLVKVRRRRQWPLALLPLLFGLHQLTEGLVWLGLDGQLTRAVFTQAVTAYLIYSQVFLPSWVPLAVLIQESEARRRRLLGALLLIGAGVSLQAAWGLWEYRSMVTVAGHSLIYYNPAIWSYEFATAYVVATCGSLVLASDRRLLAFGLLNLAAIAAVVLWKEQTLTSVWCAYAALMSVLLYRILDTAEPAATAA